MSTLTAERSSPSTIAESLTPPPLPVDISQTRAATAMLLKQRGETQQYGATTITSYESYAPVDTPTGPTHNLCDHLSIQVTPSTDTDEIIVFYKAMIAGLHRTVTYSAEQYSELLVECALQEFAEQARQVRGW